MDFAAIALVLIVAILVAGIFVWLRSRRAKAVRQEEVKEINYLLDRVVEAAAKRKTQLYQSLDGKDNQALVALRQAADQSSINIDAELQQIDTLWQELSQQVGEFSDQSVGSTLQSSVVTSRAATISARISEIAQQTKKKLAG